MPRFWPLGQHDLSGKTAIPFITHGGYGLGNSISVLRTHAPWARYVEGFSMLAPQLDFIEKYAASSPRLDVKDCFLPEDLVGSF